MEDRLVSVTKRIDLGEQPPEKRKDAYHVPSTVQPDTLFHFVSKLDYLLATLERKMISPRYCREDVRYLQLQDVKELAFPMSCFCDIGLQKLEQHMGCYGYFGIAFPKKWCMDNGFQAIHYLNKGASLAKDVKKAFRAATKLMDHNGSRATDTLSDFLLQQLMYYKPYQGRMKYRVDGKTRTKCLADECEWRYIPDVEPLDMDMVIRDEWTMNNYLNEYSAVFEGNTQVSLKFEYDEVKYIMVQNSDDFSELLRTVEKWEDKQSIGAGEARRLLSKVLVWNEIKGDF